MGNALELTVVPWRIEPAAWREVYAESVRLVRRAGLMGEREEAWAGLARRVYTRDVERAPDDPAGPGWRVVGDAGSGRTEDPFGLDADLDRYRALARADEGPDDVLLAEQADRRGGLATVFAGRTRGAPYHVPLLAVGLLLEDRFPRRARISGDLLREDVERARDWIREVVGREVAPPIDFRAEDLYARLTRGLAGEALLDAWWHLHRPEREEDLLRPLAERLGAEALAGWFARKLSRSPSPRSPATLRLFAIWLASTGDLDALCALSCRRPDGPRYAPRELAAALAGAWYVAWTEGARSPYALGSAARLVARDAGQVTPEDLAPLEAGAPGRADPWPGVGRIVASLASLFPGRAEDLGRAAAAEVARIREERSEAYARQEAAACGRAEPEEACEDGGTEPDVLRGLLRETPPVDAGADLSPGEQLLLRAMIHRAARIRTELEADPRRAGELWSGPRALRRQLVRASGEGGVTLSEDAWAWLDLEGDPELLRFAVCLVLIREEEPTFLRTRRAVLADRARCRRLFELSQDDRFLGDTDAWLRRAREEGVLVG